MVKIKCNRTDEKKRKSIKDPRSRDYPACCGKREHVAYKKARKNGFKVPKCDDIVKQFLERPDYRETCFILNVEDLTERAYLGDESKYPREIIEKVEQKCASDAAMMYEETTMDIMNTKSEPIYRAFDFEDDLEPREYETLLKTIKKQLKNGEFEAPPRRGKNYMMSEEEWLGGTSWSLGKLEGTLGVEGWVRPDDIDIDDTYFVRFTYPGEAREIKVKKNGIVHVTKLHYKTRRGKHVVKPVNKEIIFRKPMEDLEHLS